MDPLHVLLVVNSYVTARDPRRGAKFQLHVRAYAQKGLRVGVVAVRQRDYSLFECARGLGVVEDCEYGAPIIRDCTLYSALRKLPRGRALHRRGWLFTRGVERYIKRHGRPDIMHAHGSQGAGEVAFHVHSKTGIPYVLTEHMSDYAQGRVPASKSSSIRRVFEAARFKLPVSQPAGEDLERVLGDSFQPWVAVPNMVDIDLFASSRSQPDHDRFTLVTVGRLAEVKGLDIVLQAFAIAFRGGREQLRIVGEGTERENLEQLTMHLALQEQVQFLGHLSRADVACELGRASAYVLASRYETFGIPVVEAHAAGKPVIATRCGGPESLVEEGKNGFSIPVGSVEALADAMRRMKDGLTCFNPESIRADCWSRFAPFAVVDQLSGVYREALIT